MRSQPARPRCGVSAAGLSPPFGGAKALKLNMGWHNPDLYFFLCLLTGLAAFLANTSFSDGNRETPSEERGATKGMMYGLAALTVGSRSLFCSSSGGCLRPLSGSGSPFSFSLD